MDFLVYYNLSCYLKINIVIKVIIKVFINKKGTFNKIKK